MGALKHHKAKGRLGACKALPAYGFTPKANEKAIVSAYDLVRDLIGKQRGGPGDLSTNPKYMEGFGR